MIPVEKLAVEALAAIALFMPVIAAETAALRKLDAREVERLRPDKESCARRYQSAMTALAAARPDWEKLARFTRQKLADAARRLDALMAENLQAAQGAQRGAKRLVDTLVSALRQAATPAPSYAPPRASNPYASAYARQPLSVAINATC